MWRRTMEFRANPIFIAQEYHAHWSVPCVEQHRGTLRQHDCSTFQCSVGFARSGSGGCQHPGIKRSCNALGACRKATLAEWVSNSVLSIFYSDQLAGGGSLSHRRTESCSETLWRAQYRDAFHRACLLEKNSQLSRYRRTIQLLHWRSLHTRSTWSGSSRRREHDIGMRHSWVNLHGGIWRYRDAQQATGVEKFGGEAGRADTCRRG